MKIVVPNRLHMENMLTTKFVNEKLDFDSMRKADNRFQAHSQYLNAYLPLLLTFFQDAIQTQNFLQGFIFFACNWNKSQLIKKHEQLIIG